MHATSGGAAAVDGTSRRRPARTWSIAALIFALLVALVLLYMWGVVLEGTDSGPGVTGGVAITAGVAVLGLAFYLLGRPMSIAGIAISITAGVFIGAVAGYLLGGWVADHHVTCSDGVRSLCGAPGSRTA